jgi:hypothetical protein
MKSRLTLLRSFAVRTVDIMFFPLTVIAAIWMKLIRTHLIKFWSSKAPITKFVLNNIGVFPITAHYYEPFFYKKGSLKKSLRENRNLPGINFNDREQLDLLNTFNYNEEILHLANLEKSKFNFTFNNETFLSGDAETAYNIVRHFKPNRIIEVGCGNSTLILQHAISMNIEDGNNYSCNHVCIEPYHYDHLAEMNVEFLKSRIEDIDIEYFKSLQKNDILFIDSSHMIRPQGDVLLEYLEILPILNSGVIVHIHDIFSPRDYLDEWIKDGVLFWNEQYLLEAFLMFNSEYKIICANNYLMHNFFTEFKQACVMLEPGREPGSFWIQKL